VPKTCAWKLTVPKTCAIAWKLTVPKTCIYMEAYRAKDLLAITDVVGLLRGRGGILDD
jgi:hypothetical protein